MDTLPEPWWWLPSYPVWVDPYAGIVEGCQVCGVRVNWHNKLVMHHVYSRQIRPEVIPLCRVCEGAVHGRNEPKPGRMERVLQLRLMLPAFAVRQVEPGGLDAWLVKEGVLQPLRERVTG